jgi:hypothetical protein
VTEAGGASIHAQQIWRATLIASALTAGLMPLDILISSDVPGMPWWPAFGASAVGAAIVAFVVLVHRRTPQSARLGTILFLALHAAILAAMWISGEYHAQNPRLVPYQAHKLGPLAVAILAPEAWAGALCIAGFVALPLAQMALFDPATRARIGPSEPLVLAN